MSLKYLFTAEYKDGTLFTQNPEDVSAVDPKRSAFFDVKHDQLIGFVLSDGKNTFGVDLTDGHFEINGVPFFLHETEMRDFKLFFFRRHSHTFSSDGAEQTHTITYRLGWRAYDPTAREETERIIEFA